MTSIRSESALHLLGRIGFLAFLLSVSAIVGRLAAQPPEEIMSHSTPWHHRWTLAPGLTHQHVSEASGWGIGVALTTAYRFAERWGAEFTPALILSSNGERNSFSGPAGDLGATATIVEGDVADLTAAAGVTGILGSDGSGTLLAKGGAYAALRAQVWLSDWAGLYTRGAGRFFNDGSFGGGGAVGLAVRF